MQISFLPVRFSQIPAEVIPVFADSTLPPLWRERGSELVRVLQESPAFQGKAGQTLVVRGAGAPAVLLGLGRQDELNVKSVRALAPPLYKTLERERMTGALVRAEVFGEEDGPLLAAHLADALRIQSYGFTKYKTARKQDDAPQLACGLSRDPRAAEAAYAPLQAVTDSVFWASDLCHEPANVLYPEAYAERIRETLAPLGARVTVLRRKEMEELGMNLALAVGGGGAHAPCMAVMEYDGGESAGARPVGFVGKGVCFDSGGLDAKPAGQMSDMIHGMAGSAAVAGAVRALAATRTHARVVAVAALAENLSGAHACRPGDILRSMSGRTVHVEDTDAEGRLVMADAMTYLQYKYDPGVVVDAATLTGACMSALGTERAGVFASTAALRRQFNAASRTSGEGIWHMPQDKSFAEAVRKTPHADLTNYVPGACGQASLAAAFLRAFVEGGRGHVHIDMAGPGFDKKRTLRGYGVRLLHSFVRGHRGTAPC